MTFEPGPPPLTTRALGTLLEPATAVVLAWLAAVGLIVHSDPLLATLVGLGAAGAFVAGLVGVGGAIVVIPLLIYVPPALGTGRLTMHDVSGVAMVQVMAAAAAGVAGHLREGFVNRRVVAVLGSGMMFGSAAGAVGSRWVGAEALQGLFAVMAAGAALTMLIGARTPFDESVSPPRHRRLAGFAMAFGVGLLAGAVGAGGAFLLIPLMLYMLRLPPKVTIGTSLAIVLAGAGAGVAGKLVTGQIPGWPALALVAGALPAAALGAAASHRLRAGVLRGLLAVMIVAVAAKMWWDILR